MSIGMLVCLSQIFSLIYYLEGLRLLESKKPAKASGPSHTKTARQPVASATPTLSDQKEDQVKVLQAQLAEAKKRTATQVVSSSSERVLPTNLLQAPRVLLTT
jgi:hypothetical protein